MAPNKERDQRGRARHFCEMAIGPLISDEQRTEVVNNVVRAYGTLHRDHAKGATESEILEKLAEAVFWSIAAEVTPQQIDVDQLQRLHVGLCMTWCDGEDFYHGGRWAELMHSDEGTKIFIRGYDKAKDEFLGLDRGKEGLN